MRGTQGNAVRIDSFALLQALNDFIANRSGNAGVVDGDENGRVLFIAADSEGFGPEVLQHALGFFLARSVAAQTDWIARSDVDPGDTDR